MRYLPWYAFSLPTKRRRPFGEKHAAFYPKRVTKKSKNALENRVFDFALVSPSEYEKG